MASFRLNIARVTGCPAPAKLAKALESFGLPEGEEFGVLNHSETEQSVVATLVRRTHQAVQRLDAAARQVTSSPVEKVALIPFAVRPAAEVMEIYAGSASAFEQVGAFLAGALGLPTAVEAIELDIVAAIQKLSKGTQKFQLRSVRVKDYAHNAYMSGPYAPRFLDSAHGMEFLEEYGQSVVAAGVRFAAPTGRATVNLTPLACFSFSCNDEDQPTVQTVLRKLVLRG